MPLNAEAVQTFVEELDQLVPRAGAYVRVETGSSQYRLLANRAGYLRWGIELLKAGLAETHATSKEPQAISVDWEYLFAESPIGFSPLLCVTDERVAETTDDPFQARFRIGFYALLGVGAVLAAVGLVGVAVWLMS